ncbi:uncharacterized protein SRS1_15281 [Sporisorium reilianum f. sp. reilianum]|uniref:Uncharacterized protein n=1 Tax=Sporisorium reilianum f. sp. reilianum TaxID=72559 RepID=A0A2N8UJH3_9BASI|nr:uncharacterized protein SRS1_15281 [Sporisorium reilianum f. sp. reilianum]
MMSEISFTSTATPLAKSRRISILPISHADLSSPTTARKQLQLLELDNVALSNELTEREEQVSALEAELSTLRAQLSSSSSATPMLSSSASTDSLSADQRASAEVKAAKRLLHRLIAQIAAYDTDAADEINLDQSMVHDPERSIVQPSSTHISTPNGKNSVARRFEGDLLDDVETLGGVLREYARRTAFAADEQAVALQREAGRAGALETRVQELEAELERAHAATAENEDKDAVVAELRADLSAAQQRESDLKAQLSAAQTDLDRTTQKLDQITAEQELTISAAAKKSAALIEALQLQLDESHQPQEAEAHTCSCAIEPATPSQRTLELEAELTTLKHERDLAAQESSERITALEQQLDERRTKASDLQTIFNELQNKKQRLHTIQMHNAHIRSLEKVLVQQQRIVNLLDRPSGQDSTEWIAYAEQLSASLAQLQADTTARNERADAAVTADVEVAQPVDDELVRGLRETIDELDARILRRNEQIGSLQRQLHNVENDLARTRTNQMLAEETVGDLDAERAELLVQVKRLEERVAQLEREERVEAASQTALESENAADLKAELSAANQRIADLAAERTTLHQTITTLTQQIHDLTTTEQQHDADLCALKATLLKTEDRLSATRLEHDTAQLALAAAREAASGDAERAEALTAQLDEVRAQNETLAVAAAADATALAESRGAVAELTSQIAALENDALSTREETLAHRSALESELKEAQDKLAELHHVLEERDEAMRVRNTEYWTLKEELAELQEDTERSHDAAALLEVQAQLAATVAEKSTLEERITAQESALLKLKADLTAARSTEDLLNQQYASSQRRVADLEAALAHLESASAAHEDAARVEQLQSQLAQSTSEIEYLSGRIDELESELGRKAEEIEEADSKILDALKESKKYATRYTKLTAKYEALQRDGEVQAKQVQEARAELERERERVRALMRGKGDEGAMVRSGSGGLAGRKRAKPDSSDEPARADAGTATPSASEAKAVYAPSPSTTRTPSSFTPVRRTAKPTSRTTKPAPPANSTPVVLGHGTPTTAPEHGDMVRSTSNPSALIATRLLHAASPAKPLLSDKTNLASASASAGTSRLSSKGTASAVEGKVARPATSLLPHEPEVVAVARKRGDERKGLGASAAVGAGAGGGAADFLARMKAQRAASAAAAGGQRA